MHWVSAAHAVPAEVRLYDRLFAVENPGTDEATSFLDELNPDSLVRIDGGASWSRTWRRGQAAATRVQFERVGYFCRRPGHARRASRSGTAPWALKGQLGEDRGQGPARSPGPNPRRRQRRRGQEGPSAASAVSAAGITIEICAKVDLRVGMISAAAVVPEAQTSSLRLMVDLGEGRLRQIFAGLRASTPTGRAGRPHASSSSPTSSRGR